MHKETAVVAACVALALSASPAAAQKKAGKKGLGPVVTRIAASPPVAGPGQATSATAVCPKGRRAVGGGFDLPFSSTAGFVIYESLRAGARGWRTSAFSGGGASAGLSFTSSVYCRRLAKPILDIAAGAPVAPVLNATATATARCPGSKSTLISGGFSSGAPTGPGVIAVPYASFGSGRVWSYSAINNSPTARTLIAHAYCAKGVQTPLTVLGAVSRTAPSFTGTSVSSTTCPKGRRLSAGGFIGSQPSGMTFGLVTESRISGRSWVGEAFNVGAAGTVSLTVQGICL